MKQTAAGNGSVHFCETLDLCYDFSKDLTNLVHIMLLRERPRTITGFFLNDIIIKQTCFYLFEPPHMLILFKLT